MPPHVDGSGSMLLWILVAFLVVLVLALIADRYLLFSEKRTLPWAFNGEYDGGVVTYKVPAMSDCMTVNYCPAEVIGYRDVKSIPVNCRFYPLTQTLRCTDTSTGFINPEDPESGFTIVNIT